MVNSYYFIFNNNIIFFNTAFGIKILFAFFAISFSSSFEACYVYINPTEEIYTEYPKNSSQKSKLLAVFFVDMMV